MMVLVSVSNYLPGESTQPATDLTDTSNTIGNTERRAVADEDSAKLSEMGHGLHQFMCTKDMPRVQFRSHAIVGFAVGTFPTFSGCLT